MTSRASAITVLGRAAALGRRVGLSGLLAVGRDGVDGLLIGMGIAPLKARVNGVELRGFLRHRSFLEMCAGAYEPLGRKLFLEAVRPGCTVVDGGAHIGLYALLAAARVGDGMVLAFEPDPLNFRALLVNVARNRLTNVRALPKALTDAVATTTLHSSAATMGSSLVPRADIGRVRRFRVETTTLDRELEGLALSHLVIKLDVEGSEPQALHGMRTALARAYSVVLIVEVNPFALRQAGASPQALVEDLTGLQFQIEVIDERAGRLLPPRPDLLERKGNLYCVRTP